jgi:hypothetical protein
MRTQKIRSYTREEIPDLEPREYWSRAEVTNLLNLTFERAPDESWSLPRAQLVRYSVRDVGVQNEWPTEGRTRGGDETMITFRFSIATITVQSDHPAELLKAVLSGKISVLVRGPAKEIYKNGKFLVPDQTRPEAFNKFAPYALTGHINAIPHFK